MQIMKKNKKTLNLRLKTSNKQLFNTIWSYLLMITSITQNFVLISKHPVLTAGMKFAICFELDNGRGLSLTILDNEY